MLVVGLSKRVFYTGKAKNDLAGLDLPQFPFGGFDRFDKLLRQSSE
jgi:hypothetical protein